MGFMKLRKNKRFNHIPRFYDDKGQGNPFEIKHKFDDYRSTIGTNNSLKGKVNNAFVDYKQNPDRLANRRVLIIIAVLIIIFLFIIDFDLSIFFSKK
jgi:hypothetical protein